MELDLVLTLSGDAASSDELRSLRAWLLQEDELRGCVETVERPPAADRLGPVLEALRIVADPAADVLAAVLVAWLTSRVGAVRLVLRSRSGESVELDANHVRGLDVNALAEFTERITRLVSTDAGTDQRSGVADGVAAGQVEGEGPAAQPGEQGTGA